MIKYLSILHMAKNVLRKQFGNMYGKNQPFNVEETPKPSLPPIEPPTFTMKGIILFTILVFLGMLLYFNWESILTFVKRIYTDFKPSDNLEKIDQLEEKYNELTKNSTWLETIMGRLDQTDKMNKELSEQSEKMRKDMTEHNEKMHKEMNEKAEKMHKETIDNLGKNQPTLDPTKLDVIQNRLDAMEKERQERSMATPAMNVETPAMNVATPAMNVETPAMNVETPARIMETAPNVNVETPARSIEQKEKERKRDEKQIQTGGLKQLDERLSNYRKDQIAHYNGFCYIGYDNKRECTNIYEGDICMSGQIFPTMEICVNP